MVYVSIHVSEDSLYYFLVMIEKVSHAISDDWKSESCYY